MIGCKFLPYPRRLGLWTWRDPSAVTGSLGFADSVDKNVYWGYGWNEIPDGQDSDPICNYVVFSVTLPTVPAAAVAQWVRTFTPQAEGWVFEFQPQQTYVVKTDSDSSTAKRSPIGVSVTGPRRWLLWTDAPCHSRCGTLKNPHCSLAINAKQSQNF